MIVTQLRMDVERGLRSLSLAILDSRCDSAKVMAICMFQNSKICKLRVFFYFWKLDLLSYSHTTARGCGERSGELNLGYLELFVSLLRKLWLFRKMIIFGC